MAGKKKESIGEYVDIDSLVEWEHNPRINTQAVSKVARSIERSRIINYSGTIYETIENRSRTPRYC